MPGIHAQHWPFGGMAGHNTNIPTGLLVLYTDGYIDSGKAFYCPVAEDKGDNIINYERTFPLSRPLGNGLYQDVAFNEVVNQSKAYYYTFSHTIAS